IYRPPLVNLYWRSDVRCIEAALSAIDAEALVLPLPPVTGHPEMTRVELHVLITVLHVLAMSESLVSWLLDKNCLGRVVTALAAMNVDSTCFLIRANLVLWFLHRCNLRRDSKVEESTRLGSHGREATYLLAVMADEEDSEGLLT